MIGDNLNISISLSKTLKVAVIQGALVGLKNLPGVHSETFKIEKNQPEQIEAEVGSGFKTYHNRFCFDYEGNDYGLLAYFSVVYYSFINEYECEMLSITPFNHPAGQFLSDTNVAFTAHLKTVFAEIEAFDLLLYSDDSNFNTPMLLSKYKVGGDEIADEVLYALK